MHLGNRASNRVIDQPALSPVGWQSAFWGIVLVAFNGMLQDSGVVLHLPFKYQPILRSSPLVCLLDSVFILLEFAFHCFRNPPLRALRKVAANRKLHKRTKNESINWSTSEFLVWIVRILAIIQAIKVFGLQGVPWTQAFTAMFLLSYVLVEILAQFAGPYKKSRSTSSNEAQWPFWVHGVYLSFSWPLCSLQLYLWAFNFHFLFPGDETLPNCMIYPLDSHIQKFLYSSLYSFTCCCLIAGYKETLGNWVDEGTPLGLGDSMSMLIMTISLAFFIFQITNADHGSDINPVVNCMNVLFGTGVLIYCLCRVLTDPRITERFIPIWHRRYLDKQIWGAVLFFIMNFGSALIYYSRFYTKECTVKPAWTENLG